MAIVLLTLGMEVGAVEVSYVSGGIGADVREELLAKEKEYNLKVVVAEKSGDYLAGVQIVIESGRKEQVLDTTMEGPILMARLAPGRASGACSSPRIVLVAVSRHALQPFRRR